MEDFQTFKNNWLGRRTDYDHVYEYQCVDLILQGLHDMHSLASGVRGNAIDYWNSPSPALMAVAHKIESSDAIEGDIVIMRSVNPLGHIAWATGNIDGTNLEILEQNGSNGDGDGGNPDTNPNDNVPLTDGNQIRTRWVARSRVVGLIRFNNATAAPTPAPVAHTPGRVGQLLVLPASVSSWRVYNVGGPWTVGNEVAKLNPQEFNGLEYEILGNPAANIYIIHTGMFGEVAIYAGSDTPASFKDKEAPAPAPAPEVPVVPAPAPKPANITYTRLVNPQYLTVNRNTHEWDLGFENDAHATAVADLAMGTPFTATGLAQRTDGDKPAYFMTEEDFGNADQSGTPNRNVGVNTVDLSPAPAPQATTPTEPIAPPPLPPVSAPAADGSEQVRVTVKPADWHNTFTAFLSPQKYVANANVVVADIDESIPITTDHPVNQQLIKDQNVTVAGTFTHDGIKYYRTAMSVAKGYWYGIPVISLTRMSEDQEEAAFDRMLHDVAADVRKVGAVARPSGLDGFVSRMFHHKK